VKRFATFAACAALALPCAARAAARFAVVVGNNHGATGRARLWFAEKDAERFARALRELGDFSSDRIVLLQGATPSAVREALTATEARIASARAAGERALLVVYFSGHAGPQGLELGDQRIGYEDLRKTVSGSAAEAKVAIVDACEAGTLTQVKGAVAAPALDFPLPEDAVQGTAFLASTAIGESAQESQAIGGSFFTHHLEIALRGAGDMDGDGQVTLAEAFRYTASRTVAGTAATQAGPQHPTYDFKMSGRGDVVLADLRRAEASLRIPADQGAMYLLRGPRELFAEVPATSAPILLALPSGHYAVERRSDLGRATAQLDLMHGDVRDLPPLVPTRYEMARAKGGGPAPTLAFLGGGIATFPLAHFGVAPTLRAGVRQELGQVVARLRVDVARQDIFDQGLQYSFSRIGGTMGLLTPIWYGPVMIEAGGEVGYGWSWQDISGGSRRSGGDFFLGPTATATTRLGPVRVGLDGSFGAQVFKLNGEAALRAQGSLGLVVLFGVGR
jgi:Caspase domain